jgi:PBP1b-binding outer membrane lipoprotein LpoB
MAKIFFLCGFLVLTISIAGCSEANAPAEAVPQTEAATAAPAATSAQGVIPQAQLDAMAKAAATGTVLEQAEQERRKQMEAQGL